ncbi:sedoheptulokinase isoform X2 [Sceloporus undulatus]|nr:sedoheptulokinase isoform X2 [Sceloporus undulatus]XP_042298301.1 sedoheptulokinase isoform X2 [Sceloporus undulatus]XP_042298302.1 sedoheptulokinase isoform X2 [Sceloporus undulatus]
MQTPPESEDTGSKPAVPPANSFCVLGIDMGTTSVKAVLVEETDRGPTVVASCTKATKAQVESHGATGLQRDEQDVHKIVAALNTCLANLPSQSLGKVCHIGVSGQMHGVVFWKTGHGCKWLESEDGWTFEPEEVSRLVTWQDGRCGSHFLAFLPRPKSHLSVATGYGCATIFWYLKNSPDFLKPYDAAGTIQDYVVAMLCGQERPRMSIQNAASWGYFSTTSNSWNTDILQGSRFPVHLLPEVVQPGETAGETTFPWHGIPKGTKVGAALGDFQCSVYSCMTENTDAVLNIGTSAQLTVSMPSGFQPGECPDPRSPVAYYPYFDNRYLAVAASLNGGNVMATFVNMLLRWMAELGIEASESDLYPQMIQAALAQTDTGLAICPTVFGERHTPERLASVTGIAASDLSLGHVTRALCRGVVQNLHSMLSSERLKEAGVKRILAGGSGLYKNEVMRQEVEKAYPFPVVYGKDVDAAVGAALSVMRRK